MPKPDDVGVGVAALISKNRMILLGLRKGAHRAGFWACPGGWIDRPDKRTEDTCTREVKEETGIIVHRIEPLCWTSEDHERFRTVTLYHLCVYEDGDYEGEPQVLEPHKCERWQWFDLDKLPTPLYPGLDQVIHTLEGLLPDP